MLSLQNAYFSMLILNTINTLIFSYSVMRNTDRDDENFVLKYCKSLNLQVQAIMCIEYESLS